MYFDLNVPISKTYASNSTKKGKGNLTEASVTYSPTEITAVERRIDLLVHLGYTIIGLSQTLNKRVDPKTHYNVLEPLLAHLRKRPGIVFLKRLNIILDQDSEKGFGLINANVQIFNSYDLLALFPTTHNTFNLACLTHSLPSNLTSHIISLPLTLPRLPFHLKHTVIRTAIKNGAVFEINYVGSLDGEPDKVLLEANAAETGPVAKRNWWAASRELIRVTKGKGILLSGGCSTEADLRAPRDMCNILTVMGLSQDAAHEAATKTAKSLVLRAETRKTYRAVLSEPTVVLPTEFQEMMVQPSFPNTIQRVDTTLDQAKAGPSKRPHDDSELPPGSTPSDMSTAKRKKKRKPNKAEKTNS